MNNYRILSKILYKKNKIKNCKIIFKNLKNQNKEVV